MAYSNVNTYSSGRGERKLQIREFRGIDQSRGIASYDHETSPDAENFISRYGVLRTAGGVMQYGADLSFVNETYTPESKPRLFQAFFRSPEGEGYTRIVASFNRTIYAYDANEDEWVPIGFVEKDGVDLVNYRHGLDEWAIFSDGAGKLYYWDGSISGVMPIIVTQGVDPDTLEPIPVLIQQITLNHERLFGAITQDAPDRIYWSASFSPDDWEINDETPDDGGGFVDVATFDGSKIRAIIPAFDGLLVFKDRSVHKITGTFPGEFAVSQVYGTEGTLAPRSVVDTGSAVYFLSSEGLCKYDGVSATSLRAIGDRKLRDVWALMNNTQIENACAAYHNGVIYLAVSLDQSESRNTHVIEYDVLEGTYSIVAIPGIDDFVVITEGQKKTLYAIVWNKVYLYDSGGTFFGENIDAVWTSPEISMGTLTSKKQTGYAYLEVEGSSLTPGNVVGIKLSVISGDYTRTKIIYLRSPRQWIRTRLKVRGRTFRFRIENMNGDRLVIHRGLELIVEETFD